MIALGKGHQGLEPIWKNAAGSPRNHNPLKVDLTPLMDLARQQWSERPSLKAKPANISADERWRASVFLLYFFVMINQEKSYELRPCACCAATWLYPSEQPCVACHGIGHVSVPQPVRACSRCGGAGRARHAHPVFGFACEACWGSGWEAAVWVHPHPSRAVTTSHWPRCQPTQKGDETVVELIRKFIRDEEGQDLVEYALLLVFLAPAAIAITEYVIDCL